ncbi:glycosyltransferase family 2 protein [Modestobacter sp. URMC 112]
MSLAVVICTYTDRRLDQVCAAVHSALAQAQPPADEMVVTVDYNDELLDTLRARLPTAVRVLANREARGLSGARNTGWQSCSADAVVFLDDDAVLRPGSLAALRARLGAEDVAVVGGAVHPAWEGGEAPWWFPEEFTWVVGCDYRGMPVDGSDIRNPIGACMAARRVVLQRVGGFSTGLGRVGALPAGCEETLLGIQVHELAPRCRVVRDVAFAVDHTVPRDRQRAAYFMRRCLYEGRSKAALSRMVGHGEGLSSERSYVLRVLTSAVLRHARSAACGDRAAAGRAGCVLLGLTLTVAGLVWGHLQARVRGTRMTVPAPAGPPHAQPDTAVRRPGARP